MLTLQAMTNIEGNDRTGRAHLELSYRNSDILERVLNHIGLSNCVTLSNRIALSHYFITCMGAGKCTSMKVIKQPGHGRTSTTQEQK